ncbi:MAG TPA: N-acetylneuraminate synthase [Candidatus Margulisbacteria bacterium]|nr:MAG: N-acetylneuraminate synthase [Candidatus Margulisbacteria bacterium GWD2_39_127]HAR62802.1 N-acetylneuraminate synthase [Candidatus Margulisiibacteriota bacterium]
MNREAIKINNNVIANNSPVYIVAEAGVNHNGSLNLAFALVQAAKDAGADCVKFQTFKAENLLTSRAPKARYQLQVTDQTESQYEMLSRLALSASDFQLIMKKCKELEIDFLSTPYNKGDVDLLIDIGVNAFKIASGQIVEIPFLKYVAKSGNPIILSTGMADLAEVYRGVNAIRGEGNNNIVLLQCTTNYPSVIDEANVLAMKSMEAALNVWVGYSDHVESNYACFAAVALGARVIEKHLTLDKNMSGPDHRASLDPKGFSDLVKGIRGVEKSLGSPIKRATSSELKNIEDMRRSIVALECMEIGTELTERNCGFKRPAGGLAPNMFDIVLGKKVAKRINKDEILLYSSIDWGVHV